MNAVFADAHTRSVVLTDEITARPANSLPFWRGYLYQP
ncbi:MAG: hypothetical protein LBK99_07730 [Opitutaceae bacterium]|nr:hypothetical protein [Opitutaceae bacterium]